MMDFKPAYLGLLENGLLNESIKAADQLMQSCRLWAILEMHRQVGDLLIGADGIAQRGLLVRHLVLPKDLAGTRSVMRFIAGKVSAALINPDA